MERVTPQERIGLEFICAGNDRVRETIESLIDKQHGSVEANVRSQSSLTATPNVLCYESPMMPLCIDRAAGSRVYDVDANEYIDCHLCYTSNVLGHNPKPVEDAVHDAARRGVGGAFFREQIELAELVQRMVPDTERVAYFHTGGEAINAAVRLARAKTGRRRVAKFEGCYHGSNEFGLHNTWMVHAGQMPSGPLDAIAPAAATAGLATGSDSEFLILPYNSPVALELVRKHADELACVIADPLPPFMAHYAEHAKRFMRELSAVTNEVGVPLVLDEVVAGFRIAKGGGREWAGIQPQMSCFGKITSGLGAPLSLIAGDAEFLDGARTDGLFRDYAGGKVWVASTLSSNLISVAACMAQLRMLDQDYEHHVGRLDSAGAELRQHLATFAARSGIPVSVEGSPRTFMTLALGDHEEPAEKTFRGLMAPMKIESIRTRFALVLYLRMHGVHCKYFPTMNLSSAHSEADVLELAGSVERALLDMQRDGVLSY